MSTHASPAESPSSGPRHQRDAAPAPSSPRAVASGSPVGAAAAAPAEPFIPVARTAADLLAIIPHTLACWPRRSAVLLTASAGAPGPCLRVDLPESRVLADEAAVLEWTAELSDLLEHDVLGDRVYLAVFIAGTRLAPHEIERVVEAVGEAGALSGHALAGAWEVGSEHWVDLEEAEPRALHRLEEIRSSALWTAMVVSGSAVAEREDEPRGPARRRCEPCVPAAPGGGGEAAAEAQAALRVEDCRALVRELERRCGSRTGWGGAETAVCAADGIAAWQSVLAGDAARGGADRAGGLDPAAAGCATPAGAAAAAARLDAAGLADLLGVVMDPVGSDAAVVAVLTGDAASAAVAWEQAAAAVPGGSAGAELRWMLAVLSGRWDGRPDWGRAAAFESVLELLLDLLHGAPARESGSACLREAEAWLWVATAHLERFRGRGSWASQWLQLAEEAVPGHAGAARARLLGSRFPVPVWATDPVTAWHRGR
ncbi:hypothetical protein [Kocuria palustris]|uniref:hypothetical protein n=1 Tax=Kocuria palustris TaxID=71999 RepID=UPI0011A39344|nr:hypothetical protein [Kocuria palustris]